MGHSTHDTSGAAARAALGLSAAFLAALAALHGLEPELDPSWRMISEYALGRYGWVMTLAFLCWSGSVLAVLVALWPEQRPPGVRRDRDPDVSHRGLAGGG